MEKPFAIVDGQLYINEALIGEQTVGMVPIGGERLQVLALSLSSLSAQVNGECAARTAADSALAARIDSIQSSIRPGA